MPLKKDYQESILETLAGMRRPVPALVVYKNCPGWVYRYLTFRQVASRLAIMARQGIIETEEVEQQTLYYIRSDEE